MRADLDNITPEWEGKLAVAGLSKAESATIQECNGRSLHWWQRTTALPTTEMIDKDDNAI